MERGWKTYCDIIFWVKYISRRTVEGWPMESLVLFYQLLTLLFLFRALASLLHKMKHLNEQAVRTELKKLVRQSV